MGRLSPETTEAAHGTMTPWRLATTNPTATIARPYSPAKAAVVRLALWGLLPVKAADWIILRGALRDA